MRIPARSPQAKEAYLLVEGLQAYFVSKLNSLALAFGEGKSCVTVIWGRDSGKHGGGYGSHIFGPSWKETLTKDQPPSTKTGLN